MADVSTIEEGLAAAHALYGYLRSRGTPIPTNDLWIAALVVQHDLVLLDRDSDCDRLLQLARLRLSA